MHDQYEWLQDIIFTTANGKKLFLRIGEFSGRFKLYGELFTKGAAEPELYNSSHPPRSTCKELVESYLRHFNDSIVKEEDRIIRVWNPCNTPFWSGPDQQALLNELGVSATVEIN